MNAVASPAEALAGLSGWERARVVRRLRHGRAADTWMLVHRGRRWVLRLDHADAETFAQARRGETAVFAAAAKAGVAPPVELARPEQGLLITRFVDGRVWAPREMHDPVQLQRLARRLRALHRCAPTVRRFDLCGAVERYARAIGDTAAASVAARVRARVAAAPQRPEALCHNDLVCSNVVDDGQQLWLVDWEFGGLGNPLFDLAVVGVHHDVPTPAWRAFLDSYFTGAVPGAEIEHWCGVYADVARLWERFLAVVAAK